MKMANHSCEIVACYFYAKEMCIDTLKSLNGIIDEIPAELKNSQSKYEAKNVVCEFLDKDGLSKH